MSKSKFVASAAALAVFGILLYWLFTPAFVLLIVALAALGAYFLLFPESFVETLQMVKTRHDEHSVVVKKSLKDAQQILKGSDSSESDEAAKSKTTDTASGVKVARPTQTKTTAKDSTVTTMNAKTLPAGLEIAKFGGTEVVTDARINRQYIAAFPDVRERYPLKDYASFIEGGSTLPFVTWREENGVKAPVTTALVEDLGEIGMLLSYVWTRSADRCKGIGREHLVSVFAQMQERKPGHTMFIEVEDPEEAGLKESERNIRQRRLNWYIREFNAQRWEGEYVMPSLRDPNEDGLQAILLAVADHELDHEEFLAAAMHILVASYEVPEDHRYVMMLDSQRGLVD